MFRFDEARLLEAVAGLSEGGRAARLHLYIYNGPAQRRWHAGVFPSFAAIRSPCIRCASGNDARVPRGVRIEVHTSTAQFKNRRGVVSNDGEHTRFSFEPRDTRLIPLEVLNQSLSLADQLQSTYLLWIARYQDSPYGYAPLSPNDRHYRTPTAEEEAEIVEFLRR